MNKPRFKSDKDRIECMKSIYKRKKYPINYQFNQDFKMKFLYALIKIDTSV